MISCAAYGQGLQNYGSSFGEQEVSVACLVDKPFGIKRYIIVASNSHILQGNLSKLCEDRFTKSSTTADKEVPQLYPSTTEFGTYATVGSISCVGVKFDSIPTVLFFLFAFSQESFQTTDRIRCLDLVETQLREPSLKMHLI